MDFEKYISLGLLVQETGLPKTQIKRLAKAGLIPAIKLGNRYRFDPSAVHHALARLSATDKRRQTVLGGGQ
jgi:excisionase family DNA binding protein